MEKREQAVLLDADAVGDLGAVDDLGLEAKRLSFGYPASREVRGDLVAQPRAPVLDLGDGRREAESPTARSA